MDRKSTHAKNDVRYMVSTVPSFSHFIPTTMYSFSLHFCLILHHKVYLIPVNFWQSNHVMVSKKGMIVWKP